MMVTVQSITFEWSAETCSLILGSFYYGYAISQLPGGLLSTYWKPQHVFGLTVSLSGLLCALLPFIAVWNVNLVITCRFLMGFLQVCTPVWWLLFLYCVIQWTLYILAMAILADIGVDSKDRNLIKELYITKRFLWWLVRHSRKHVVLEEEQDKVAYSLHCCLSFTMRLWSEKSATNVQQVLE